MLLNTNCKEDWIKSNSSITIAGVFFAVILFFSLFYFKAMALIDTRNSSVFFVVGMFKEVIQKEDEEKGSQMDI